MAGKNTAVFGIYPDRVRVEAGVDSLVRSGFRLEDISVLLPENIGTKDFAHEKHTKAPEGATAGAGTGPIMGALAGAYTGGVVGGLIGALVGMGIPEYEAKRYEGMIKKGGMLLSVHCDNSDWVARAKDILRQTGAEEISSSGGSGADYAQSDKPGLRIAS